MPIWVKPPKGKITEHFTWTESVCHCCGKVPSVSVVTATAFWLEKVRKVVGGPIHINSWCRCRAHQARVNPLVKDSYHTRGVAVDFTVEGQTPHETRVLLNPHHGRLIGGIGRYQGFTHIDRGPTRDWEG